MNKQMLASITIFNRKMYLFPVLSFMDSLAQQNKEMDITRYHQLKLVAGEVIKQRIEKVNRVFLLFLQMDMFNTKHCQHLIPCLLIYSDQVGTHSQMKYV